jgi:hypothetical protein
VYIQANYGDALKFSRLLTHYATSDLLILELEIGRGSARQWGRFENDLAWSRVCDVRWW